MTAGIFAVAPSDRVGFVLQMAALGALVGTGLSVALHLRDDETDTWLWPATGSVVGACGAVGWLLFQAVS